VKLLSVLLAVAGSGGGRNFTSSVGNFSGFVTESLELVTKTGLGERPDTLVLGLLLAPGDLSIFVLVEGSLDGSEGEGRDLLNSYNSNILDSSLGSLGLEVVVDLTRAVNNLADAGVGNQFSRTVINDLLEAETGLEVFKVGVGVSELEELLGGNDNERLSESSTHLSSEQMEVLGSGGAVGNKHVVLFANLVVGFGLSGRHVVGIGQRQVSLDTAGGVFGTLSIVTVRKEKDEAVSNIPLGFTRGNELIDHDLGTVGEITELGFPETQSVGVGLGVPVFETEHGVLREMRVGSDEVSLVTVVRNDVVNGHVATILVLVEHMGVSVRESSTLDILSRETHVESLVDQTGEGQSLSCAPVNAFTSLDGGLTGLENLLNLGVELAFGG